MKRFSVLGVIVIVLGVSILGIAQYFNVPNGPPPGTVAYVAGLDGNGVLRPLATDTGGRMVSGGAAAAGTPVTGNPVLIAGTDGTNVQTVGVDASNRVKVIGTGPTTGATAVSVLITPSTNVNIALTNNSQTALTTAVVVKAGPGNVFGAFVVNASATTCYLEFMNASSAPTLGTAAVFSIPIPGSGVNGGVINIPPGSFPLGNFSTGISVGLATTYNGNTACGSAGTATLFYL